MRNDSIRIKYRINGALFRRTFDNEREAQIRIAVLRANGIEVTVR